VQAVGRIEEFNYEVLLPMYMYLRAHPEPPRQFKNKPRSHQDNSEDRPKTTRTTGKPTQGHQDNSKAWGRESTMKYVVEELGGENLR